LRRAQELAPDNARYAYVCAVALNSNGAHGEATALLERTHRQRPADREVLTALVSIAQDAGDPCSGAVARASARRARSWRHTDPQAFVGARKAPSPLGGCWIKQIVRLTPASPPTLLERVIVTNKAVETSNPVVERPRRGVVFLRGPVEPVAAALAGGPGDRFDEPAADATASAGCVDE
jgi:hypothetical protein